MKKVLFVIRELCGGGAERALSNIVTHFPDDWEIDILLNNRNAIDFPYKGNILSLDIPEPKRRSSVVHQGMAIIKRTIRLVKLKKENHYMACISFLDSSNIANILSGKKYCKTIISIRGSMSSNKLSLFYRFSIFLIIKLFYHRANKIVTVSKAIQEELIEQFQLQENLLITIENGYDINEINQLRKIELNVVETDLEGESKLIVTIGRLNRLKGQWHLIRAFKNVTDKISNVKLVILGDGELKGYLQKLTIKYHLENKILFKGFISNPFNFMDKGDVFVLPSLSEGFPNALAEALCCGMPCIATDFQSGARELLSPNNKKLGNRLEKSFDAQYGILVPLCSGKYYNEEDKLESQEVYLAEAIIRLLNDKELNKHYRMQSYERSKTLNIENIVKKWISVIEG